MSKAPSKEELVRVLAKFADNPVFVGLELVSPTQKGALDETALHIAARMGSEDDIKTLVVHGADINAPGDVGNTPLHFAAMKGRVAIVELLLRLGARTDVRNEFNETALDVARNGDHVAVERLLSKRR